MELSTGALRAKDLLAHLFHSGLVGYPIEFEFEQADEASTRQALGNWFGSDRWAADGTEFLQFGLDGTGGMYLLWGYPDLEGEPPVVILGSEGGAGLIATSLAELTELMTCGESLVTYGDQIEWITLDESEDTVDWPALRRAVSLPEATPATDPNAATQAARASHPDFPAWVHAMVDH